MRTPPRLTTTRSPLGGPPAQAASLAPTARADTFSVLAQRPPFSWLRTSHQTEDGSVGYPLMETVVADPQEAEVGGDVERAVTGSTPKPCACPSAGPVAALGASGGAKLLPVRNRRRPRQPRPGKRPLRLASLRAGYAAHQGQRTACCALVADADGNRPSQPVPVHDQHLLGQAGATDWRRWVSHFTAG